LSRIERGGLGVPKGSAKEEVYLTIEVTIDITGILCTEKGWK